MRRSATLACPIVKRCLVTLAESNIAYVFKSCVGIVTTSVDDFAAGGASEFASAEAGPFALGTGEDVQPCGYQGLHIYANPVAHPGAGMVLSDCHPANATGYVEMPWDVNVFPMLAMTNPTVADAVFNENNCRSTRKVTIHYFDNRHHARIVWPRVNDISNGIYEHIKYAYLQVHEVVWRVPDLTTIETHKLVAAFSASTTVAATQALLRTRNKWLFQMYNAYYVKHPVVDATITDVTDIVTGPPVNAFDTYHEPTVLATPLLVIANDNILPRTRDAKEYIAVGVLDRRKDAKPVWQRKRKYRRPTGAVGSNVAVHEDGSTGAFVIPQTEQIISCGNKFNINAQMVWEKVVPDAAPDSTVREVVPRGAYVYCKYHYYDSMMPSGTALDTAFAPKVFLSFTRTVDKTHITKWSNS